ncbi:TadE/TadG family type IV pilus assembly protein [Rhizobium terrae]|uniref:TadE/TadG family type IV pilus assembly protein n=1 Tax=Rhizobium terrae TaxID=2171756 RepID=UPI000E3C0EF4|nr:TadE/TadG family type IV pilus assembly protein [Rhizobium terrae]
MCQDHDDIPNGAPAPVKRRGAWKRILRSEDGAAAIEFTILAIPYFLIVFAILETFIAFTGEQLVSNAVDTMARQLRTGNITYNLGRPTDMNQTQFRRAFCDEVSIIIQCSEQEIATPGKLLLDVRSFPNFSDIPLDIKLNSSSDLDTASFAFTPGAQNTINMLRAYYRWSIITDLLRPLIANIKPAGGDDSSYFLIVETAAFRNEDFP